MSTLRVSTIQDTAGSNSSTPAAIANGIAKAWVSFNGTGTVAIKAQYNVSSITDRGVGAYTVNFTNALADANYPYFGFVKGANIVSNLLFDWDGTPTTSAFPVRAVSSGTFYDTDYFHVAVFR
jgi:hypothetical protein